jgi:dipeptidase D
MEIESHPKYRDIFNWFEKINQFPRCPGNEAGLRNWLINWANNNRFESKTDKAGNLVIKVPASTGYENSPVVIIQGHLDMVCEKTPDSTHDFTKDPIALIEDGEWIRANKTTLGSDNGIAIAIAMTLALDKDIAHPPLELLFTVEEETGLIGASALDPTLVTGRTLINIDAEDEGSLVIGCAGGLCTDIIVLIEWTEMLGYSQLMSLNVGGMKGGHSGVDIHKERANAIKVLVRTLQTLKQQIEIRFVDIQGGTALNAIPREAEAVILVANNQIEEVKTLVSTVESTLKAEYKNTEPNLFVQIEPTDKSYSAVTTLATTHKIIDFMAALPYGVAAMSTDIEGLVETSNNFAKANIQDSKLKILTSQRSSVESRLDALTHQIEGLARLIGAQCYNHTRYPAWQPNMNSPLLAKTQQIYQRLFGKKPIVEAMHAGLETGIIGKKLPGIDMISVGPTIKDPHSPDERIHIGTIGNVWDLTVELLKEL